MPPSIDPSAMREPDFIADSKRLCRDLERHLPHTKQPTPASHFVSDAGVPVIENTSLRLATAVGALAWRAHDLGSLAVELFERERVVPGAIIARSLMETTALVFLLSRKASHAIAEGDLVAFEEFLMRCVDGSRLDDGRPDSPNVLTAIQAINKEAGCDRYAPMYFLLCEFAHPNALGSFYAYAAIEPQAILLHFGQNKGRARGRDVAFSVVLALSVLLEVLNRVEVAIPPLTDLAKRKFPNSKPS